MTCLTSVYTERERSGFCPEIVLVTCRGVVQIECKRERSQSFVRANDKIDSRQNDFISEGHQPISKYFPSFLFTIRNLYAWPFQAKAR